MGLVRLIKKVEKMLKRIVSIKYFGIILLKKEIIAINSNSGSSDLTKKIIKYFLFGTFKVKEITENYTRE